MCDDVLLAILEIVSRIASDAHKLTQTNEEVFPISLPGGNSPTLEAPETELKRLSSRVNCLKTSFSLQTTLPISPDESGDSFFERVNESIHNANGVLPLTGSQTAPSISSVISSHNTKEERDGLPWQQNTEELLRGQLLKHKKANEAFQEALREIGEIITAVASGDLTMNVRMDTVEIDSEITTFKRTINAMMDRLQTFASEVSRVAREVGTEGLLGGQALIDGVDGTWKELTDNGIVNRPLWLVDLHLLIYYQ